MRKMREEFLDFSEERREDYAHAGVGTRVFAAAAYLPCGNMLQAKMLTLIMIAWTATSIRCSSRQCSMVLGVRVRLHANGKTIANANQQKLVGGRWGTMWLVALGTMHYKRKTFNRNREQRQTPSPSLFVLGSNCRKAHT